MEDAMKLCREKYIRIMAGSLVLLSLVLALMLSRWWLLFTAFVGCNLIQSAFTDFCPAETLLKKMGIKSEAEQLTKEGGCCQC
ncbi:MAG: DUF2892 domain-containing protein [Candidatus Omnitrophica bacterium]|nr:DUF2892 domain-containing protein [Candidatus Omnitrophota bacterium]